MEPIIALLVVFASIVGVIYLLVSTRHKERMALIEKGMDASILHPQKRPVKTIWKILLVNLALLLVGIGLGVFLGGSLHQFAGMTEEIAFPASIFTLAGSGLFVGYKISSRMD